MTIRPLQFLTGVLVGVLVGGAAVYQVGHEPIQRFISDAIATFDGLTGRDARPAVPASEKEQPRQVDEQAKAKSSRDQQARQQRLDQQAAGGSQAVDAAARKERAWAQHYKTPAKCDGNPNSQTMTECANDYIRSRRQFDEAYERLAR